MEQYRIPLEELAAVLIKEEDRCECEYEIITHDDEDSECVCTHECFYCRAKMLIHMFVARMGSASYSD